MEIVGHHGNQCLAVTKAHPSSCQPHRLSEAYVCDHDCPFPGNLTFTAARWLHQSQQPSYKPKGTNSPDPMPLLTNLLTNILQRTCNSTSATSHQPGHIWKPCKMLNNSESPPFFFKTEIMKAKEWCSCAGHSEFQFLCLNIVENIKHVKKMVKFYIFSFFFH